MTTVDGRTEQLVPLTVAAEARGKSLADLVAMISSGDLVAWIDPETVPAGRRSRPRKRVQPAYLSLTDAAERYGITDRTLRRWIDSGSLPALRVGTRGRGGRGDYRVPIADLERLLGGGSDR